MIQKAAARHRRRLQRLEDEQTKLWEAHYKGNVSESVMRSQTERIETEERTLKHLLDGSEVELTEVHEALEDALKLTETPLETYLGATNLGKRLLNQAFFSEIRVGEDGEVQQATVEPPYARIIAPRIIRRRTEETPNSQPNPSQRRPNADPFSLGPAFDLEQDGAP